MTLNRLAEILTVDLNYFSESFHRDQIDHTDREPTDQQIYLTEPVLKSENQVGRSWDMSKGNWENADFSGLKNLKETVQLFQYQKLQVYKRRSIGVDTWQEQY